MDKLVIHGGRPLHGRVEANGSKNAALPILLSTLLTPETCEFRNIPELRDIRTTVRMLEHLGKTVEVYGSTIIVSSRHNPRTDAPYDLVKQMRASFLVAGPLLARFHRARVALPGGCAIGLRPIDIHLKGFEAMGAKVDTAAGDVLLKGRLKAGRIRMAFPSVGATENLMMAAAATEGETRIENAAREPEIEDLGEFLGKLGADVKGAGTSTVRVRGAKKLKGAVHSVIPDRIEAGTLLIAGAAAGGDVTVGSAEPRHLKALIRELKLAGARVDVTKDTVRVRRAGALRAVSVSTKPHPGFPTDLQAPWMALMCVAKGSSTVTETIFEKRFLHAAELIRMGADIHVHADRARIEGVKKLVGAPVMSSDLRAGAALVVAGLAAHGTTTVSRVYHIDRGYERIERKLGRLGARIKREKE